MRFCFMEQENIKISLSLLLSLFLIFVVDLLLLLYFEFNLVNQKISRLIFEEKIMERCNSKEIRRYSKCARYFVQRKCLSSVVYFNYIF